MKFPAAIIAAVAVPLCASADDSAERILAEMNLARTQPRAYARVVAELGGRSRATAEAVRFLDCAKPQPALTFSPGLAAAALEHVLGQGPRGSVGHERLSSRLARHGQWFGGAGENIDYGTSDARATVVRLIVDEGVPGRKHRANIFQKNFRVAGVATGYHARFGTMCVIDFAGGFAERGLAANDE
jgi:uncharacterized protein YkwD